MNRLALADLPAEVQDVCALHQAWYAARNVEDGPPAPPVPWTLPGATRHAGRVYLALGIAAGLQRGDLDMDRLRVLLVAERARASELQLAAEAGVELARTSARVTELSALLLSDPVYGGAVTEPIPTQRAAS